MNEQLERLDQKEIQALKRLSKHEKALEEMALSHKDFAAFRRVWKRVYQTFLACGLGYLILHDMVAELIDKVRKAWVG